MMQWEGQLVKLNASGGGGVSSLGVRFTMSRKNDASRKGRIPVFKIRLGVDVLRAMQWIGGDRIGVRWSTKTRHFNLYRTSDKNVATYSVKIFNKTENSSGCIEINPNAIGDENVRKIVADLCARNAEPDWSTSSDGLIVEMVA